MLLANSFSTWVSVERQAEMSAQALAADEQTLEEIYAEDLNGGTI